MYSTNISLCCPITGKVISDPVIAADGQVYQRASIEAWLRGHDWSPVTGVSLINFDLKDNSDLRAEINDHLARRSQAENEDFSVNLEEGIRNLELRWQEIKADKDRHLNYIIELLATEKANRYQLEIDVAKLLKESHRNFEINNEEAKTNPEEQIFQNDFGVENGKTLYLIERGASGYSQNTRLIIYNIEKPRKQEQVSLNLEFTLGWATPIIQLPDSQLFFYGDIQPVTGNAIIVDTKNFSIKKLPPGPQVNSSGGLYYKDSVYFFGGTSSESTYDGELTLAQRFNLAQNKWEMIASLPMGCINTSCIIFMGDILIAGLNNQSVYSYNPVANSYLEIFSAVLADSYKLLLAGENRAYMAEQQGKIYESEINDFNKWSPIGESCLESFHQFFKCFHNGNWYISMNNGYFEYNYYKFDLKTKELKRIETI